MPSPKYPVPLDVLAALSSSTAWARPKLPSPLFVQKPSKYSRACVYAFGIVRGLRYAYSGAFDMESRHGFQGLVGPSLQAKRDRSAMVIWRMATCLLNGPHGHDGSGACERHRERCIFERAETGEVAVEMT